MVVGKVEAHLCLTLIVKKLEISVEHGRVVHNKKYNQTLNILFSVVSSALFVNMNDLLKCLTIYNMIFCVAHWSG